MKQNETGYTTLRERNNVPTTAIPIWLVLVGLASTQGHAAINFVVGSQTLGGTPAQSIDVALGYINQDDNLDVVVANLLGTNRVWMNRGGTNGFVDTAQASEFAEATAVALADLDNDGDLDLLVTATSSVQLWTYEGGASGKFQLANQFLPNSEGAAVAIDDLNGDGHPDAFIACIRGHSSRILFSDGTGRFTPSEQEFPSAQAVALGDLDGDGDLDALIGTANGARILLNTGRASGKFEEVGPSLGNSDTWAVALGYLDGDQYLDAVTAGADSVRVWTNQAHASAEFNKSQQLGVPGASVSDIALGDFDGDLDLDLFVVWVGQSKVYENIGNGIYSDTFLGFGNTFGRAVALGHIDDDDLLDAVVADSFGQNKILFNRSTPPIQNLGTFPKPGTDFLFRLHHDPGSDLYQSSSKLLRLGNDGGLDLRIDSISFDPGDTNIDFIGFSVIDIPDSTNAAEVQLPHTLHPGERIYVSIGAGLISSNPPAPAMRTLRIKSNDPRNQEVTFNCYGEVVPPSSGFEEALFSFFGVGIGVKQASFSGRWPKGPGPTLEPETAIFGVDSNSIMSLTTHLPAFLGGGVVTISNFTGSVSVSSIPIHNQSAYNAIKINDGVFTAPSFRLPSGLETGPNTLTFGPPVQSGGFLILSNGSYSAFASATISNALFPGGIQVNGNYRGTFDRATGRATLASQSIDSITRSERLNFSASAGQSWLTWFPGGVLQAATNVLGPWFSLTNVVSPFPIDVVRDRHQFYRAFWRVP